MPISGDRFEEIQASGPDESGAAKAILSFLRDNPESAYTQAEIASATDLSPPVAGSTLARLHERGRVDHKGDYWRVSDHERSSDTAVGHSAATASSREATEFAYEQWQTHAVDPREHR